MKPNSSRHAWGLAIVLAVCTAGTASANVQPAAIFANHMVLQRDRPIPIWGMAAPGETVKVSFAGETVETTADEQGRWRVRLPAQKQSGEGRDLTIGGKNTVVLNDVIIGDVWLCSGQSNMYMTLNSCLGAQDDIAAAHLPAIREVAIKQMSCASPLDDVGLVRSWTPASPKTAPGFTAVGFYFARKVYEETGIPIGLINASWGSTPIETWLAPEGVAAVPELSLADAVVRKLATAGQAKDSAAEWRSLYVRVFSELYNGYHPTNDPAGMFAVHAAFNAMIRPLVPYGLKGVLWYQGEGNGGDGEPSIWEPRRAARKQYGVPADVLERDIYFYKMQALVGGWRALWKQGDFPVYFVQLASYLEPTDNPAGDYCWVPVREAQTKSLKIPHTGMAVAIDIGEVKNIHPVNKYDVGLRLARWALARDYGRTNLVCSGPLYKEMQVKDGKIRITFNHVGGGLMVGRKDGRAPAVEDQGGKLARFAIAGKDKAWHWAEARIDGDIVMVGSDQVPEPVAVRYAWSMTPAGANLYNKDGLPASPFRTDDWE